MQALLNALGGSPWIEYRVLDHRLVERRTTQPARED
jgi:hypothetical protein